MKLDRIRKKLEKDYRKLLDGTYPECKFPINCEFCRFVGNPIWHCLNRESCEYGLNVTPYDVCNKWSPNEGLMIYLWKGKNEIG